MTESISDPKSPSTISSMIQQFVHEFFTDLYLNPINLILFLICCFLLYKIFKLRFAKDEIEIPEIKKRKIVKRNLTLEQLREFDGVKNETIILALNGKLYDVTNGASFYGPNGPYNCLAGRDATRAFATFSLDGSSIKDDYDDISDLSPSEMDQMKEWEMQLDSKYFVVGKLLRPGEVSEIIDSEEEETSTAQLPENKTKSD